MPTYILMLIFKIRLKSVKHLTIFFFSSITELRATMRVWLLLLVVLATLSRTQQVASTTDNNIKDNIKNDNHSSNKDNNNKDNLNNNKLTSDTLVQIEKNLLSILGLPKRPKIDRSKIVIPKRLREIYEQTMGHELSSVHIPAPGSYTQTSNTMRSFVHQGKSS